MAGTERREKEKQTCQSGWPPLEKKAGAEQKSHLAWTKRASERRGLRGDKGEGKKGKYVPEQQPRGPWDKNKAGRVLTIERKKKKWKENEGRGDARKKRNKKKKEDSCDQARTPVQKAKGNDALRLVGAVKGKKIDQQ